MLAGASTGHDAALLGIGADNDDIGFNVPNKLKGGGLVGDQRASVSALDAYSTQRDQRRFCK